MSQNVGVERLSARQSFNRPDEYELLIQLTNGGSEAQTRELVVATESGDIAKFSLHLAPGQTAPIELQIPAASRVQARLRPGDALVEDDELGLELAALRRRPIGVDAACPPAWLAAVNAHPALALARAGGAAAPIAAIDCGSGGFDPGLPVIRVLADRAPAAPRGPIRWSASLAGSLRLQLDTANLQTAAKLKPGPGDEVLLAAGDEPLIVAKAASPRLLETSLDFGSRPLSRSPEAPLLADIMIERLLGTQLLGAVLIADRGAGSARVTPSRPIGALPAGRERMTFASAHALARPILIAAWLVLLWEIVALARQWLLLRVRPPAGPA